mmetsp:Transcript_9617/g.30443  ORF Transcript_9617/g.30443 Transcript_9617/m.30443 type:complete len:368 (-) Transcript_9617:3234-4337(-)
MRRAVQQADEHARYLGRRRGMAAAHGPLRLCRHLRRHGELRTDGGGAVGRHRATASQLWRHTHLPPPLQLQPAPARRRLLRARCDPTVHPQRLRPLHPSIGALCGCPRRLRSLGAARAAGRVPLRQPRRLLRQTLSQRSRLPNLAGATGGGSDRRRGRRLARGRALRPRGRLHTVGGGDERSHALEESLLARRWIVAAGRWVVVALRGWDGAARRRRRGRCGRCGRATARRAEPPAACLWRQWQAAAASDAASRRRPWAVQQQQQQQQPQQPQQKQRPAVFAVRGAAVPSERAPDGAGSSAPMPRRLFHPGDAQGRHDLAVHLPDGAPRRLPLPRGGDGDRRRELCAARLDALRPRVPPCAGLAARW